MYIYEQSKNSIEKIINIYRIYLNFVYVITAISLVLTLLASKVGLSSDFMFYYLFSLSCLFSLGVMVLDIKLTKYIGKYEDTYKELHPDTDPKKTEYYVESYSKVDKIAKTIFICCIILIAFVVISCLLNGEPKAMQEIRFSRPPMK